MIRNTFLIASLASLVFVGDCFGIEPVQPVKVYWDISHGVIDNYQPSGRYGVLVDHLAPQGFQFIEGNVPLDVADLSSFDVLVLANGSYHYLFPTPAELAAVESFLLNGGGLLVLADVAGSGGNPKIQQFANLFGAQVGVTPFPGFDVYSTSVGSHPAVKDVDQIYIRFSNSILPGSLTAYAFYDTLPMLAAGDFGGGRVVLIADGDLFTYPPIGLPRYFDLADNRQLAESVFRYLAVPEPTTWLLGLFAYVALALQRLVARKRGSPIRQT